ncbi:unnamed protein product, partial [Brassica oleracea]
PEPASLISQAELPKNLQRKNLEVLNLERHPWSSGVEEQGSQ